jgi:glycolate oxidase
MQINEVYPENLSDLQNIIIQKSAMIFCGSKTSTVMPFDFLTQYYQNSSITDLSLVQLTKLPKKMLLQEDFSLLIEGPVTWSEARAYLRTQGRDIMTAPTEELALVLSGLATSATGEHSFRYGTLREQVKSLEYMNFKGEVTKLDCINRFENIDDLILDSYQSEFSQYQNFKNAPYPRFEKEIDLMIGTEGQLGVITQAVLLTKEFKNSDYIFIKLPRWEDDLNQHIEVLEKIQSYRDVVNACELIDSNALKLVDNETIDHAGDLVFFEIDDEHLENFYENFFPKLSFYTDELAFQMSHAKFTELRVSIPRAVNELNNRKQLIKKGTDVQVKIADFSKLIKIYRDFSQLQIPYLLFGHFGDAHLHFNFLPSKDYVSLVDKELNQMYQEIKKLNGSPFAEHGIGLIKKDFIKKYYSKNQINMFQTLKNKFDPKHQFFPLGFMD